MNVLKTCLSYHVAHCHRQSKRMTQRGNIARFKRLFLFLQRPLCGRVHHSFDATCWTRINTFPAYRVQTSVVHLRRVLTHLKEIPHVIKTPLFYFIPDTNKIVEKRVSVNCGHVAAFFFLAKQSTFSHVPLGDEALWHGEEWHFKTNESYCEYL